MKHSEHIRIIQRIALLVIMLALQAALIISAYVFLQSAFTYFYIICMGISFFVVVHIVREDTNPTYKIPWIILSLLFPALGGLAYLMFGRLRFSRSERRRTEFILRSYMRALGEVPDILSELPEEFRTQSKYLRDRAHAPLYKNTRVEFYPLGEEFYKALLPALESAKKFIFLEYFIIAPGQMWDSIVEVLTRKAAEGVDVRVIYDDMGSLPFLPADFDRELQKRGIACHAFNRFTNIFSAKFNNRDHRKICVIDGNIGFTGGLNLADEYINAYPKHGHWKDSAVMLEGEGVWSFTAMFLSLWDYERKTDEDMRAFMPSVSAPCEGFVQPYDDMPNDNEYVGETVYRNMINHAHEYIYITTPYLIIDNEMISALTAAAKGGVDVRIITPGIPDKKLTYRLTRSYYGVLLEAGVRIYEYTPGFVHAKEFVCDDRCAVVGTINLDYRSLCHHFECAAWMCDVPAVSDIKSDFIDTLDKCREITPEIAIKEFGGHPLLVSFLRLFAPLF